MENKVKFYDDFKCTADKCPITCCREWKIYVDDDTKNKWKSIDAPETEIREDQRVIKLSSDHDCPFLCEDKLCRMVIEHGDSFIPETCRIFPRQINDYGEVKEYSLTACCPAVVDMFNSIDKFETTGINPDIECDLRDAVINLVQNKEYSIAEALQMGFYVLLEGRTISNYDELVTEIRKIKEEECKTFSECNEIFLDIAENYREKKLYSGFLTPLAGAAEKLESEEKGFSGAVKEYDALLRKYLSLEIFGNLYLPDTNINTMVTEMQWIAIEYVTIRQAAELTYLTKGELTYEDMRECIVIISRMTGYDIEDVEEYLRNSFKSLKWDWGYLALITGRR